jgi:hypothetical protein
MRQRCRKVNIIPSDQKTRFGSPTTQAKVLKSSDPVECALLTIDWNKRTIELRGAGGHDNDQLTPQEVLRGLCKRPKPDTTVYGIACWLEDADGYGQLCFYDESTWASEVYGPE